MKIVMIHGQGHKGITYTMAHTALKYLTQEQFNKQQSVEQSSDREEHEVREFFLPKDGPNFCVGCNQCFLRGEEFCQDAKKVQPIMEAIKWADIIMVTSPNYVMEMSGSLKNLFDHFGYRWITHRPHPSMFTKVAMVFSSSAGAPPNGTVKSMAKQLKWMCVPKVYGFSFISSAMSLADLTPKKKELMEKKAARMAKKVQRFRKHPFVGLRTRLQFLMFRKMQVGEAGGWNPTDQKWWQEQGWIEKKRPWKK